MKAVSKEDEPPDAIRDFEAVKGKTLKPTQQGRIFTVANLYDKGPLDIPEGYQAVGVRVNVETTASGLASLPGARVNLLLTIPGADAAATKAFMLLENVLVLAADIRVTAEGEIAAPAQVVTFGLKNDDVMKVTVAKAMGIITLVLRNKDDTSLSATRVVTGRTILDQGKKVEEPPTVLAIAPPPPPPPPVVEKVKEPETPKKVEPIVVRGHYDIVSGQESGPREVTRVHYILEDDDAITIERTELIGGSSAQSGSSKKEL